MRRNCTQFLLMTIVLLFIWGPGLVQGQTTRIGSNVWLRRLPDLDWKIQGTGDFNGDGKTDILWRYYGATSSEKKGAVRQNDNPATKPLGSVLGESFRSAIGP